MASHNQDRRSKNDVPTVPTALTETGPHDDSQTIEEVRQGFWKKLKHVVGKIPFTKDAVALYYCMEDPNTPLTVKLAIAGALAYFIAPSDAIPDVLPGIGYVDDASVIAGMAALVDAFVTEEHRDKARRFFES